MKRQHKTHHLSPYILFSIKERPTVVKMYPKMGPREVFEEIGKRWNNLGHQERLKYELKRKGKK